MKSKEEIEEALKCHKKSLKAMLSEKRLPNGSMTMKEFTERTKLGRDCYIATRQQIRTIEWVLED